MKLPERVKRKRRTLYTQEQLAALLGISRSTLQRMEGRFLSPLQVAYLNAVRYEIGVYPRRKRSRTRLSTD